jgi:hypothetical protein
MSPEHRSTCRSIPTASRAVIAIATRRARAKSLIWFVATTCVNKANWIVLACCFVLVSKVCVVCDCCYSLSDRSCRNVFPKQWQLYSNVGRWRQFVSGNTNTKHHGVECSHNNNNNNYDLSKLGYSMHLDCVVVKKLNKKLKVVGVLIRVRCERRVAHNAFIEPLQSQHNNKNTHKCQLQTIKNTTKHEA